MNPSPGRTWNPEWFNQQIVQNFEVYKSYGAPTPDGAEYTDRVLFTGYCTPIYDASLSRSGEFQWPIYKLPPDLDRDPMTGQVHGRRTADGQIVPYYTRGEIETGGKLAGDELVWLKSRWEAYVVTIQGSARLRLAQTGQIYEIGFAGTNGYAYTSPGRQMVADGVITEDQLSLRGLDAFFAAHPEMMDKYLPIDQRYVFFTERTGGPFGSLNVPVTPLATIATDKESKDIYPRAMPAFVKRKFPIRPEPPLNHSADSCLTRIQAVPSVPAADVTYIWESAPRPRPWLDMSCNRATCIILLLSRNLCPRRPSFLRMAFLRNEKLCNFDTIL